MVVPDILKYEKNLFVTGLQNPPPFFSTLTVSLFYEYHHCLEGFSLNMLKQLDVLVYPHFV